MKVSVPWLYVECALTFGTSRSLGITPTQKRPPKTEKKNSYHGSSSTMVIFLNSHNNTVRKYKRSLHFHWTSWLKIPWTMQRVTYFCYFLNGVLYLPPQEGPMRHKETQGELSQFLARDWKSLQDKRYYFIHAMLANSPS